MLRHINLTNEVNNLAKKGLYPPLALDILEDNPQQIHIWEKALINEPLTFDLSQEVRNYFIKYVSEIYSGKLVDIQFSLRLKVRAYNIYETGVERLAALITYVIAKGSTNYVNLENHLLQYDSIEGDNFLHVFHNVLDHFTTLRTDPFFAPFYNQQRIRPIPLKGDSPQASAPPLASPLQDLDKNTGATLGDTPHHASPKTPLTSTENRQRYADNISLDEGSVYSHQLTAKTDNPIAATIKKTLAGTTKKRQVEQL